MFDNLTPNIWCINKQDFVDQQRLQDYIFSNEFVKTTTDHLLIDPKKHNIDIDPRTKQYKVITIEHKHLYHLNNQPQYGAVSTAILYYNNCNSLIDQRWIIGGIDLDPNKDGTNNIDDTATQNADQQYLSLLTETINYILSKNISLEKVTEINEALNEYLK